MDFNEYKELAMRTNDGKMTQQLLDAIEYSKQICNGRMDIGELVATCIGIAGEAGEFVDEIKKFIFHGHAYNEQKAKKELGDIMWYLTLCCNALGWEFEEIAKLNIKKLEERYPNGFNSYDSTHRKPGDV